MAKFAEEVSFIAVGAKGDSESHLSNRVLVSGYTTSGELREGAGD